MCPDCFIVNLLWCNLETSYSPLVDDEVVDNVALDTLYMFVA